MINFTHNNHLKYSIGGREFGYRENSYEKFEVSLGKIDTSHFRNSSYNKELLRTADLVYKDYGKEFALFLSGGTDSEIVARNFTDIGVKPVCYCIKLEEYNAPDVKIAIELAKELDLKLNILDFDVKEFFYSGEASEFGGSIQCTQVTYLMVYHSILKIGLPSVMGGELLMKKTISTPKSEWYYTLRENEDCSAMRFSLKYNIPLVNEWFSYTPELILYWLSCPDIENMVKNSKFKLSSVSSKNAILKKYIPKIDLRKKTHGFEKLIAFNNEAYRSLTYDQIYRMEPSLDGILYEDALDKLFGV